LGIEGARLLATARRNHGLSARRLDLRHKRAAVIALVGKHMHWPEALEQLWSLGDVVDLPGREDQLQGPALSIASHVDLCAQPTSGTPQSRIPGPPFPVAACWCARTMVLSINRYWLPRSLTSTANTRSQTPAAAQRVKRLCTVLYLP